MTLGINAYILAPKPDSCDHHITPPFLAVVELAQGVVYEEMGRKAIVDAVGMHLPAVCCHQCHNCCANRGGHVSPEESTMIEVTAERSDSLPKGLGRLRLGTREVEDSDGFDRHVG